MLFEQFQHPNGQIPAYEWEFSDLNPPVHPWAVWRVYNMDRIRSGKADRAFLGTERGDGINQRLDAIMPGIAKGDVSRTALAIGAERNFQADSVHCPSIDVVPSDA